MPKSRLSRSESLKLVQRRCRSEHTHAHARAHGMHLAGCGVGAGTTALPGPGRGVRGRRRTAEQHGFKAGPRSYSDEAASFYRLFKRIFHNYNKCKSREPREAEFSPHKSVHCVLSHLSSVWLLPVRNPARGGPEGGGFIPALRGSRSSLCGSRRILRNLGRSKPLACGAQASPGRRGAGKPWAAAPAPFGRSPALLRLLLFSPPRWDHNAPHPAPQGYRGLQ